MHDKYDDEEQMAYLKRWKEEHDKPDKNEKLSMTFLMIVLVLLLMIDTYLIYSVVKRFIEVILVNKIL